MVHTADRQLFEKITLPNGIELYTHDMAVPFFMLDVIIPVGSIHSGGENSNGVRGIAHFLEHLLFDRSQKFTEKGSFEKEVAMAGGTYNATTGIHHTTIGITGPAEKAKDFVAGLYDHVFYPSFDKNEIQIQKGIIRNERNQRKYFPGSDELSHYIHTNWLDDTTFPKEQVFGSDADLEKMNKELLVEFHKNYFNKHIKVVVGGNFDKGAIIQLFSQIPTQEVPLKEQSSPIQWRRQSYHETTCKDIDTKHYIIGGFTRESSFQERKAIHFIQKLLFNPTHGPIYEWLRKEKGWTYSIRTRWWFEIDRFVWTVQFPLNDDAELDHIRNELDTRILEAIRDEEVVQNELQRQLSTRLFFYQTLGNRMDGAVDSLSAHNKIYTEKEITDTLRLCANARYLEQMYDKFLSPEKRGEFLALPEKKKWRPLFFRK